jgi:hypothetical protein
MILENNLVAAGKINRQYDDKFARTGAKVGYTVNARKPNRFVGTTGAALNLENITEGSVPITLDTQFHVDFTFSSADLTMIVDEFSDRYLKPAMAAIANKIDYDVCSQVYNVANTTGTAGSTPNDILALLTAGQKMDYEAAPRDGQRSVVWDPATNASMVKSAAGLFNNPTKISEQYGTGVFVPALGFDIGMDQNIKTLTTGTRTNGTVNGASQTGSTLAITGLGANATVSAGDVFTIAAVNAVNPQNRQSTGYLRQFTVTAAGTANGSGQLTVSIFPPINTVASNQQYQTVDAGPASGAAVTWDTAASTTYTANMAFHKDAFVLATADLEDMSQYGAWGARRSHKGFSMRITRQYAIGTDTVPCRIDVLYGIRPIYPELACRIIR